MKNEMSVDSLLLEVHSQKTTGNENKRIIQFADKLIPG
jgi:hypothetical protein